jgi:hypothetical protein
MVRFLISPPGMPGMSRLGCPPGWAGRHRVARDPAHRVRYPRGTCGTPAWPAVRAVVHDAVVAAAGRGRAAGTGAGPSEHLRGSSLLACLPHMPNSGRCMLVYLCAGLYMLTVAATVDSAL